MANELTAIDPATGDFWRPSQREYWLVAARSHREAFTCSERQAARNEAYARYCEARAEQVAA